MLPKENRLKKRQDFDKVHKNGIFFGDEFLALKVIKNNLDVSRFGIIVGLKISKKAVIRNRIKRRLRENIRLKLDRIEPGFDAVVMVRPEIVGVSYQEIDQAIKKVFAKAGLLIKST